MLTLFGRPAPLTEEERLLGEVRRLEAEESRGTSSRKAHVSNALCFPFSPEAIFALKSLTASTAHNLVQLAIDSKKETTELAACEAVDVGGLAKAISDDTPRYSFFVWHRMWIYLQWCNLVQEGGRLTKML